MRSQEGPRVDSVREFQGSPPGKNQKEGQEDQGEAKELGGNPLAVWDSLVLLAFLLALPWAPWNSFLEG